VSRGQMQPRLGVKWVDFYEECLTSYTYLKSD
jgi:arginine decarboxylase